MYRSLIVLTLALVSGCALGSSCNQQTKQKAIYASFTHSPPLNQVPGLEVMTEVTWGDTTSLRAHNANGIYDAWMTYFSAAPGKQVMAGYFGAQIKGKSTKSDMLLFSIWDKDPGEGSWQAALPRHPNCARNCNDCAVHRGPGKAPDGSTGTKCFVNIPKSLSGQTLQLRIKRVAVGVSESMYGQTWTGDEWEVTAVHVQSGQSWVVGRQLLDSTAGGIKRMSTFHEHLGCTPCRAFSLKSSRRGPWVLEPADTRLLSATAYAHGDSSWQCRAQKTTTSKVGSVDFFTGTGLSDQPRTAWNKEPLYSCSSNTDPRCDPPGSVNAAPVSTPAPTAAAAEVSCGGHTAATCGQCPQGHGQSWCNGDCRWKNKKQVCRPKGSASGHKNKSRKLKQKIKFAKVLDAAAYNENPVQKDAYEKGYGLALGLVLVTEEIDNGWSYSYKPGASVTSVASARRSATIEFTAELAEEVIENGDVLEESLHTVTAANTAESITSVVNNNNQYTSVAPPAENSVQLQGELQNEYCDDDGCSDTPAGDGDDDTGLIVGLVVGCVGAVAVVAVVAFMVVRHRAKSALAEEDVATEDEIAAPLSPKSLRTSTAFRGSLVSLAPIVRAEAQV